MKIDINLQKKNMNETFLLDRLVDDADRKWIYELIQSCVQTHFKESFDVVFEDLILPKGQPKRQVRGNRTKSMKDKAELPPQMSTPDQEKENFDTIFSWFL